MSDEILFDDEMNRQSFFIYERKVEERSSEMGPWWGDGPGKFSTIEDILRHEGKNKNRPTLHRQTKTKKKKKIQPTHSLDIGTPHQPLPSVFYSPKTNIRKQAHLPIITAQQQANSFSPNRISQRSHKLNTRNKNSYIDAIKNLQIRQHSLRARESGSFLFEKSSKQQNRIVTDIKTLIKKEQANFNIYEPCVIDRKKQIIKERVYSKFNSPLL